MLCLWGAKGGAGCTVASVAVGLLAARHDETLLVDLGGDVGVALGAMAAERSSGPDDDGPARPRASDPPGGARAGWGIAGWMQAPCPPPDALARFERPIASGLSLLPWGAPPSSPSPEHHSRPQHGARLDRCERASERVAILARLLADDERRIVVDLGLGPAGDRSGRDPFLDLARASVLVTRACYLSLSRAVQQRRPDGVLLIDEPGRALSPGDITSAMGVPVLATVPYEPAVARAVDAGLLVRRLPRSLRSLEALLEGPGLAW